MSSCVGGDGGGEATTSAPPAIESSPAVGSSGGDDGGYLSERGYLHYAGALPTERDGPQASAYVRTERYQPPGYVRHATSAAEGRGRHR